MRILFLSERFPWPLHDGGNLRTFYLLKGLAERHEVRLVAHHRADLDAAGIEAVEKLCPVTLVEKPARWRSLQDAVLSGRLFKQPLFIAKNWSDPLLTSAQRLLSTERFDAIHFNHLDTACYAITNRWPQRKVFDSHNCLSAMAAQFGVSATLPWQRSLYAREARRLRQVERDVCQQMDLVLTCSAEEAEEFAAIAGNGDYLVAPNGVDCEFFRPQSGVAEEPGSLVFTGAMSYFPNQDAATFLCREILPKLTDLYPRPKVYLVGKDPPAAVRALHNGSTVIVTGKVDDVRPFLQRATLVVVPLRHGGGTRLKILEAFAMGKAVVSTHKGAEGIPAVDGQEILLAKDAKSFADQIRRGWTEKSLRERMSHAAARFVQQGYDWQSIRNSVLDAYRKIRESDAAIQHSA